jgi:predicted DCC family thiol-disulfide oxidoreductase YuxK
MAEPEPPIETIFYDGSCGLCHRWVRFVLPRDREGRAFRFAPLCGEAFRARVPESARAGLPDSIVVLTADSSLLVRSEAVIHVLRRLGGFWRFAGAAIALVPAPLRDFVYDLIARIRYRLFARPDDVCPVVPAELRKRFDL